jgi:hypothetical protein
MPCPDVCFWHKADIQEPPINVRFRSKSGHYWILARGRLSAYDPKRTSLELIAMPVSGQSRPSCQENPDVSEKENPTMFF